MRDICRGCPDALICGPEYACPYIADPDPVDLILAMAIAPVAPSIAGSLVGAKG